MVEAEAAVAVAAARLEQAERARAVHQRSATRVSTLVERGVASEEERDQIFAQVDTAESAIAVSQALQAQATAALAASQRDSNRPWSALSGMAMISIALSASVFSMLALPFTPAMPWSR